MSSSANSISLIEGSGGCIVRLKDSIFSDWNTDPRLVRFFCGIGIIVWLDFFNNLRTTTLIRFPCQPLVDTHLTTSVCWSIFGDRVWNEPLTFSEEYGTLIELEDICRRINCLHTDPLDGILFLETNCNVMKGFNCIFELFSIVAPCEKMQSIFKNINGSCTPEADLYSRG